MLLIVEQQAKLSKICFLFFYNSPVKWSSLLKVLGVI